MINEWLFLSKAFSLKYGGISSNECDVYDNEKHGLKAVRFKDGKITFDFGNHFLEFDETHLYAIYRVLKYLKWFEWLK